jgi:hypothetical protein
VNRGHSAMLLFHGRYSLERPLLNQQEREATQHDD